MSDPFKYSSPQEDRINIEIENRQRKRAQSFNSLNKPLPVWREFGDGTGITNTLLMEVMATYGELKDIPRGTLQNDDRLPVFEAARVQFNLFKVFSNTLRYDLLHQRLTLRGKPVADIADLRGYLKNRDWTGRLPLETEVWEFARYFSYNPVQDYLNGLSADGEEPRSVIDEFAEQVLGVTEHLDKLFVRRTLIGAVARALEPGCKFDTVLVLMGPQGNGKSEFFRGLFGSDNYGTVAETSGDKDWRQAMHCVWCAELGEIDGHLRQKNSSGMKSFITDSTDKFRLPYGREITTHPRPNILVGTTNDPTPLVDPTGNRRYWVVKTNQKIDQKQVELQRDRVWGAALRIYLEGSEIYYIDYDDTDTTRMVDERNREYREEHPWEETIRLITECLDDAGRFVPSEEQADELNRGRFLPLEKYADRYLNTRAILELLGKGVEQQTTQESRRVGQAMRSAGFELGCRSNEGTKSKVWVPKWHR
jgi:hypothetical protein